jgi:hypothetical protein
MIWGEFNGVEPPYVIKIINPSKTAKSVIDAIDLLERAISEARLEFCDRKGVESQVYFEIKAD